MDSEDLENFIKLVRTYEGALDAGLKEMAKLFTVKANVYLVLSMNASDQVMCAFADYRDRCSGIKAA